jgi:hypothetical protein
MACREPRDLPNKPYTLNLFFAGGGIALVLVVWILLVSFSNGGSGAPVLLMQHWLEKQLGKLGNCT